MIDGHRHFAHNLAAAGHFRAAARIEIPISYQSVSIVCKAMSEFGAQNMVAPLRRVLMKRPGAAMANADPDAWHYAGPLSLDQLRSDHDRFVEIIKAARSEDADLIVIGTHGRGAVAHMLLGSVAEKVVRKAPCPVLTVREGEHDFVLP